MHLALVTCPRQPDLCPDDVHLLAALGERGHRVSLPSWNDEAVDWTAFDLLVIRTVWDYHEKAEEFREWVARVGAGPVAMLNPAPIILWNMHKGYLIDLEDRGTRVPPMVILPPGSKKDPAALREVFGWKEAILKPAISAGARFTIRFDAASGDAARRGLAEIEAQGKDAILQKYEPGIASEGEYSLVFFGGEFSHAVLKTPKGGDFRCQEKFGGMMKGVEPRKGLIDFGRRVLMAAKEATGCDCVYARVDVLDGIDRIDGMKKEGGPMLMELEVLEPELFFRVKEGSAKMFCEVMEKSTRNPADPITQLKTPTYTV